MWQNVGFVYLKGEGWAPEAVTLKLALFRVKLHALGPFGSKQIWIHHRAFSLHRGVSMRINRVHVEVQQDLYWEIQMSPVTV